MTKEPPVTLESLAFRRGGARLIHCARGQWAALRRGTRRFLTAQTLDQLAAAIEGPGRDWPWGNVPPHKPPARAGRGYATPPLYGVSPRVIPRRGPGHPPLVPAAAVPGGNRGIVAAGPSSGPCDRGYICTAAAGTTGDRGACGQLRVDACGGPGGAGRAGGIAAPRGGVAGLVGSGTAACGGFRCPAGHGAWP